MDPSKQPGIFFDGVILFAEEFNRVRTVPDEFVTQINFNILEIGKSDNRYIVRIETTVIAKDSDVEVYKLRMEHVGLFREDPDNKNMTIDEYVEIAATSLMFPFIREHIAAVTIRAGVKLLLLQPTNIKALIAQKVEEQSIQ